MGDVDALRLVADLERYGLGEYRSQIGSGEYRQSFFRQRSPSPSPIFQTRTVDIAQRSPSPVQFVEQARYVRGSSPAPINANAAATYIRSSPSPAPLLTTPVQRSLNISQGSEISNQNPITAANSIAEALDRN